VTATSPRPAAPATSATVAESTGSRRPGRRLHPDLAVALLFAALALTFVGPALLSGRALLPIDALFGYPPWQAHADNFGVTLPHNPLIADAILQNYSWKRLARESFAAGALPLWNPYILSGQPFMASGQNGSLYPLGALFYVIPLPQAYGWFIALHLWIGAMGAFWLARLLGATRLGGIVAGLTFGFCGFLVVSFLWPMVVSTAVWLPALLATIEWQIQRGPRQAVRSIVVGGLIVGLQFLAGHLEMSLYLLLTAGLYTALRLAGRLGSDGFGRSAMDGLVALAMVALGTGLAAIQLVPFAEVVGSNVRTGWSDYDETVGYAMPKERLLAYLVPNLFGNPTHHTYFDLLAVEVRPTEHTRPNGERRTDTEWGGKNYVEGAVYLGIMPLLLAAVAILSRPRGGALVLTIVGAVSLLLAFGTPVYALLFYGVPGVNQLHTPFRWVYPFSLCVAVLAGLGAGALTRPVRPPGPADPEYRDPALAEVLSGSTVIPSSRGISRDGAGLREILRSARKLAPLRMTLGGEKLASLRMSRGGPSTPEREARGASQEPCERDRDHGSDRSRASGERAGGIGLVAMLAGGLGLLVLVGALLLPEWSLMLAERALRRWPELRDGFGSAEMLFSYQWWGLAWTALLLSAAGVVLWLGARGRLRVAAPLIVLIVTIDLFAFGVGFNTAADTRPLDFVPQTIASIKADPGVFRVVTYGEDDTLPSNTNMLFGLQDVRGYDTIILREYVEYLESIEPQPGIPYSKVAKLFDQRSLASPLLDLLNVKYVLTSQRVSQPGWTLHAQGDGIRVYRNDDFMPRAFVVDGKQVVWSREEALRAIRSPGFDPRRQAVVEGTTSTSGSASSAATLGTLQPAEIVAYENNRVVVQTAPESSGGVLVLADVMFPGWTATVDGVDTPVLRANGLFRAVEVGPGEHTVVFRYRPLSVRVGGLLTAISATVLLALTGVALTTGRRRAASPLSTAQRVFRNSAFPLTASLLNKAADLGFAVIMFRVLGAEGVGAYTFAGVLTTYFDIVVGWGLATLITRDVARDRASAGRYLGNGAALRLVLWLGAVGVTWLLVGPLGSTLDISAPLALAIWLLVIGLLPSLLSGVLSALFMAHERMDLPAAVTVFSTISKVVLGLVALLVGWGYVGLAAVSIVTNVATLALLAVLYGVLIGWPRPSVDPRFCWLLLGTSFPLMVNGLLNQLFFKVDVLLLKPLAGDQALGWYSAAYKLIDGLQVIPASFVLALFPLLSRYAVEDRQHLARLGETGLKVLLVAAFPVAVGTTLLAGPIIQVLAGPDYLPESAWAIQILIWYLPIGFTNGLLQYVLIAVNRQRTLSVAFGIGLAFNVAANLALIPVYGYLAAAVVTVFSELVLLAPFLWVTSREVGSLAVLGVAWRPALAAAIMAGPVWLVGAWSAPLAIVAGALVYGAALLALRVITPEERAELRSLLSRSPHRGRQERDTY
jgi:O-antigen/teichoic acid export membrane protein